MGLMGRFGHVLVSVLGEDVVDYWHRETGETLEGVDAYFKSKLQVKDSDTGVTKYLNKPRFRIADLPWDEKDLNGDRITDGKGQVWEVNAADTLPTGVTTCYVKLVSRAPVAP